MTTKYYAGIGSRKSPQNILDLMTKIAQALDKKGYTLRSGGADGADKAFERGATKKEIFRPKHATKEAIAMASTVHPAWHNCNDYVRKLHGRNSQIILGWTLLSPVEFVICWTLGGKTIGGTGLGLRLAELNNIKVYNLFNAEDLAEARKRFLDDD